MVSKSQISSSAQARLYVVAENACFYRLLVMSHPVVKQPGSPMAVRH